MKRYESKSVAGQPVVFQMSWCYAMVHRAGDVTTDPGDTTRLSYAEDLARAEQVKISPQYRFKMKPVISADFDQNYEPINSTYPAAVSTTYVARTGDTLRSVARALRGDDAMWYLIAPAEQPRRDHRPDRPDLPATAAALAMGGVSGHRWQAIQRAAR